MNAAALTLLLSLPLPGVKGRIDHLSLDAKHDRLFVAALGNNSVEIVDLRARKRTRSLSGFEEPQGVLYLPEENRLVVTNAGNGRVDILDAANFQPVTRLHFKSDADNLRLDPFTDEILVGHDDGAIGILDARTGIQRRNISLPAHPEAFQLIPQDRRLFINLPDADKIAVADPDRMQILAQWKNPDGLSGNFPMAVDPEGERIFVGFRRPSALAVLNAKTGALISKLELSEDADDFFFDAKRKRLYAVCGEGFVDVFDAAVAGKERRIAKIATSPGARTGLFQGDKERLIVAAPARAKSPARLLVYRVGK